jgi:mannose-6-phosphate isomerase-like protein (cupin superfamily)
MRRLFPSGVIAVVAFVAGFGAAHIPAARAAAAPLTAQFVDLAALQPDDLPPPPPGGKLRTRSYAVTDGATVGIQIGTVPKHFHADANEIQYVVDGTGTEWLGDKVVTLKPGDLLVIPKGTPHGGSTETSGHLKILAIKTPPQVSDDVHLIP